MSRGGSKAEPEEGSTAAQSVGVGTHTRETTTRLSAPSPGPETVKRADSGRACGDSMPSLDLTLHQNGSSRDATNHLGSSPAVSCPQ